MNILRLRCKYDIYHVLSPSEATAWDVIGENLNHVSLPQTLRSFAILGNKIDIDFIVQPSVQRFCQKRCICCPALMLQQLLESESNNTAYLAHYELF